MALVNNTPTNTRLLQDGSFVKAVAFPTTATASGVIDLVQATPYPNTEKVIFQAQTTAITSSASTGAFTASFYVQQSADNTSFDNVTELAPLVVNAAQVGGGAATSQQWLLPPGVKRYVRLNGTARSGSVTLGNNNLTDYSGSVTASLLF